MESGSDRERSGPADTAAVAVEVEVKAPVDDPDALVATLMERGARGGVARTERDTYYAHPVRDFAGTDEALRVRTTAAAGTGGDGGARRVELTYKGPKLDATTKTRHEQTVRIEADDADALAAVLEQLGFEPVATVVKARTTFVLDELTVVLDDVEGLGTFAEIERVAPPDQVDDVRDAVLALAKELGLDELERRSYLELLIAAEG